MAVIQSTTVSGPHPEIAERVKRILASRGMTLYRVSEKSRILYGRSSPYFVPHNLYYGLGASSFSPSLQQIFSLSAITGYSLYDWLRVFNFNLEEIPRLQIRLHARRTVVLDSSAADPEAWVPWFRNKPENSPIPAVSPIAKLLVPAPPVRQRTLTTDDAQKYVFAKIGWEDSCAFPHLSPGSIVRVHSVSRSNPCCKATSPFPKALYLIEHGYGYRCCRLQFLSRNWVRIVAGSLFDTSSEMRLGKDVEIIGVLDLEIRPLRDSNHEYPTSEVWPLPELTAPAKNLGQLLLQRRKSVGLSFREASSASRQVAEHLASTKYFAAAGSLSDYETMNAPPRHVHKVITLCIVYGIAFSEFLKNVDLDVNNAGKQPMSDRLVSRQIPSVAHGTLTSPKATKSSGFIEHLSKRLGFLPLFLSKTLSEFSGLKSHSLNDFFWIAAEQNLSHPLLENSILVIVNRQKKRLAGSPARDWWRQTLHVLLRRDGTYIAANCNRDRNKLRIGEYSQTQLHNSLVWDRDDVEVIGQIVAVVRKL